MAELCSQVDGERGQRTGLIVRRAVMTVFAAISLLALAGAFGQRATTSEAAGMTLQAPDTVEELRAEARQQSISSFDEIRFAVLETNGKISFLST